MPVWIYRILKFMTNFIPFRAWRKSCIEKLKSRMCVYPYWRDYQNLYLKAIGLQKNKNKVKNLILGSSHGDYGYLPTKGDYNFCLASQDLYYSLKLYEKYADQLKNLQNVILFYSVFSPGFCLEKTSEKYHSLNYRHILDIAPQTEEGKEYIEAEKDKWVDVLGKLEKLFKLPRGYLGQTRDIKGHRIGRIGDEQNLERAEKALKHNQRGDLELKFLEQLIKETKQHQHNLFIVLSPAHKKYKARLPQSFTLFASLMKILEPYRAPSADSSGVAIMDFYTDFDLSDDYWFDYDHLNQKGAALLTAEIKKRIEKL